MASDLGVNITGSIENWNLDLVVWANTVNTDVLTEEKNLTKKLVEYQN